MSIKYRTSAGTSASNFSDLVVKVGDTLPIGTEVDYDGQTAPAGWQEVDDPNVYSTTETRVGTWIDGKPIYRKVIRNQSVSFSVGDNTIPHNISNFKMCVNVSGFKYDTSGEQIYKFPYITLDGKSTMINKVDKNNINIRTQDTWSTANETFIVLEYTKTTD